jgi:hypothetical protein
VGEDEKLDVVLGVSEDVDVAVLVDVTVDVTDKLAEGVVEPVPESELVELGEAPFVRDAVGVRVDDAARLFVVLGVCDGVPVIDDVSVPVPLLVGVALIVEVVDCVLLSDPVELELAPKVRDDVGVCVGEDERLTIEDGVLVAVAATIEDCVDVDVSVAPVCKEGVVEDVTLKRYAPKDGVDEGVTPPPDVDEGGTPPAGVEVALKRYAPKDGVDEGDTPPINDGVDMGVALADGIDPKDGVGVLVGRGPDTDVHIETHACEPEMTCDLVDATLPSLHALSAPSTFRVQAPPLNAKPGAQRTRIPRLFDTHEGKAADERELHSLQKACSPDVSIVSARGKRAVVKLFAAP